MSWRHDPDSEDQYGVLLYYRYTQIPDLDELVAFYECNCKSLDLLGRVRLAAQGVNVTVTIDSLAHSIVSYFSLLIFNTGWRAFNGDSFVCELKSDVHPFIQSNYYITVVLPLKRGDFCALKVGGKQSSLERHIAAVKSNELFEGTDFKLATCSRPINDKVAEECGFTSLSIRVVKELVTLGSNPLSRSPEISNAGKHLSAAEFHSVLRSAGELLDEGIPVQKKDLILLDARNLYETRIGKFHAPNVPNLDPSIRQYSDLPSWVDDHAEQLKGKRILMYCTGGIRCEMASAYIRSKGAGFDDVYQLYGGIQRYLEQFPGGGFFEGKNFVFDHRMSVGSSDAKIIGTCLCCGSSFDSYNMRSRCCHCRMLVLICGSCQLKENMTYVCEPCQKQGKSIQTPELIETSQSKSPPAYKVGSLLSSNKPCQHMPRTHGFRSPERLRILCLHGFRQNASSFKGRTRSLAKQLKNIVELVFVDAPHALPFVYQSSPNSQVNYASPPSHPCPPPPLENCHKRFAWLVAPKFNAQSETDWKMADGPFDPLQYQQQIDGLDNSLLYLKAIFSRDGPFDGVLGFSQGAAMAAEVSALQDKLQGEMKFKFVILCSGFPLKSLETERGLIKCPSLHIFGSDHGKDRQISNQASRELANRFDRSCSVIIEHDCGHIIPTRSPYIDDIKEFLKRFL